MSLRDAIAHNFWWKLLSLFLALLIWFNIKAGIRSEIKLERSAGTTETTGTFEELPIKLLNASGHAGQYQIDPEEAAITVRGEVTVLKKLKAQEILVFVNVSDSLDPDAAAGRPAEFTRLIQVFTPPGVTVGKIFPPTAQIKRSAANGHPKPLSSANP